MRKAAGLVTLADKGYQGSTYAKIRTKGSVRQNAAPTRAPDQIH
jgi:hypothetical protein